MNITNKLNLPHSLAKAVSNDREFDLMPPKCWAWWMTPVFRFLFWIDRR
jgi:hypothetical protein